MHSPLCIQLHQLAHVKAELDVGDGATGISLTAGTGTRWHQEPRDRGSPHHLPASRPGEAAAHRYSLEMLDDKGRVCDLLGDVGNHQCPGDLGEETGQRGGWVRIRGPLCCHPAHPAPGWQSTDCHPGGGLVQTSSTPSPRPWGTARGCHLPDRQAQENFNLKRQGSRTEIYLQAARLSPEMEKNSLIFPCLPSPRLFLKLSLPTGTIFSAKHKVVH